MPKKLTYEYIKNYIERYDYRLLSDEYVNSSTKIRLKCPKNHIINIRFNDFKSGKRCSECNKIHLRNKYKLTQNDVNRYITKINYKWIGNNYINNKSKLKLECPEGHIFEMTFHNLKNQNNRCKQCFLENNIGQNHPRWNPNREQINLNQSIRIKRSKKWIIKHMKHDPNYNKFLLYPDKFQLDHILPIYAFCNIIIEQQLDKDKIKKIANHIQNLQLLYEKENYKKRVGYNEENFQKYIKQNYN